MHINQKKLMCLQPKAWNLIGTPPYRSFTFTQKCSLQWKNSFFLVGQHWCRATFFLKLAGSYYKNYWSHAGQVKQKVNCGNFSLEFNSVRIAAHKEDRLWNMAKSTWKSKFHFLPYAVFSTTDQCSVMPSENFALSSINKDQLEDLQN